MTEQVIGKAYDDRTVKEAEATATITPGMGVEYTGQTSNGERGVQPVSSVEPVDTEVAFALAQTQPPRDESGSILDMDYASGDYPVKLFYPHGGDEVENALLAAGADLATASEANISDGDLLAFNDDGTLKEATTSGAAVARANEAVDNSGASSGDHARISVEVLQ